MFSSLEGWSYVDGVYFSDYTLLTIGLGSDFPLKRTVSRALLIPYAAGGILILGLVIGSVRGLFLERGKSEFHGRTIHKERNKILKGLDSSKVNSQKEFELMREFQRKADKIGRYWGLGLSFSAFLFLWLVGAMVFMYCEKWTYFDALYFAFTSLLTIGYGDFIPGKHSFSKPFFVIWSLVAVPSVTILISNMGDTVVGWFNKGTLWLGQRTILPERQVIPESLNEKSPESNNQLGERNLEVLDGDDGPTGQIGRQEQVRIQMSKILVKEIAKLAKDINTKPPKLYGWKEWERFLELLGEGGDEISEDWRWLEDAELFGNDNTETEWVMQKMCARLEFILTEDLVDENK